MPSNVNGLSRRDFLRASAGFTSLAILAACAPTAAPGAAPAAGGGSSCPKRRRCHDHLHGLGRHGGG